MEKLRIQVLLPMDKVTWLSKMQKRFQGRYGNIKSISQTINIILSEYQNLLEKMEEQQQPKQPEPSYKEVRNQQMADNDVVIIGKEKIQKRAIEKVNNEISPLDRPEWAFLKKSQMEDPNLKSKITLKKKHEKK